LQLLQISNEVSTHHGYVILVLLFLYEKKQYGSILALNGGERHSKNIQGLA
jgi:hypothetical protein